MKEVSEKITERIRKLIRLKESATQIGSEGEAHAAAAAVHRLLMEYNLSLLALPYYFFDEKMEFLGQSPFQRKEKRPCGMK